VLRVVPGAEEPGHQVVLRLRGIDALSGARRQPALPGDGGDHDGRHGDRQRGEGPARILLLDEPVISIGRPGRTQPVAPPERTGRQ
jgi:hypothetical protein